MYTAVEKYILVFSILERVIEDEIANEAAQVILSILIFVASWRKKILKNNLLKMFATKCEHIQSRKKRNQG